MFRAKAQEPRLAVINAKIITMSDSNPVAEAMVSEGERIIYVGNTAQAQKICGSECWILDLNGLTVVPGFNDNHVHSAEGGMFYLQPNLNGKTCGEIVKIIGEEVKKSAAGEFVFGHSWDYGTCPNPDRWQLDKVSPNNPVLLSQYSGHSVWVNTFMLKQLKITKDTPDPQGGKIDRNDKGEPTGVLRESAAELAYARQLLALPMSQRRKALDKALELYRSAGITSVQDNTWDPRNIWVLSDLKKQGKLTCRFTCWSIGERWYGKTLIKLAIYSPGWIRPGPVKLYADGAFSTKTAWMYLPYAEEPSNFGLARRPQAEFNKIMLEDAADGIQVVIHAIGDRAVESALDAIEYAEKRFPRAKDLRFRLEHDQMVRPEDFARFSKLGVLASLQPFALADPDKDVRILGKDRAKEAYPYKSLLKSGASISLGSDFPAEIDYQPLLGIYYAVTRKSKTGKGPLNPDQSLTVKEALYAYTLGSAYAEFTEKDKGSLEVGKLADFVVLSKSPFEVKPEKIKDIEVRYTFVGGKQVFPERK
jgi:hypothetical protein